jgi:hypothetical protein
LEGARLYGRRSHGEEGPIAVGGRDTGSVYDLDNAFIPHVSRANSPEGADGFRRFPQAYGRNADETPALAANPRLRRLNPRGRLELCKPEVTGSIPVRSIANRVICRPFALARCSADNDDPSGASRPAELLSGLVEPGRCVMSICQSLSC